MQFEWKKHWKCKELFCVFSPNGIRTWDLPISSPTLYHWAIEPTVTLFGKYLTRQYRERTTPSQIFMPCNLSSCGVCIALQASIYSECHDIVLPNGIMANTIAITENWISARSSNCDFHFCSAKTYMYSTVVHVYEKHTICISKSGIQSKKHFITQSTWSQIILAATLPWLTDYQWSTHMYICNYERF